MFTLSKKVPRMLGLKRVMYLAAVLAIAPAGFMACNEEEEDEQTAPDGGSVGDDAGSDTDTGDVDGGDADGGADTDAGLASELAP
jgi:hypothetical protein